LDRVDITPLLRQYKPGGTSSYHPRMLLKVLVYGYINNIYSSRKIEEALQQNICFMWLAGMSKPDHNTINRFRGQRLQKTLQPIFTQVVLLLCEEGLLSLKDLYTDGTKIEANANRYTFVWGNSIKTNKEKIKKQLDELWQYAQKVAAAQSILMTDSATLAADVERAVTAQLKSLPRAAIADASWRDFGAVILVRNLDEALPLIDAVAPEHLEVMTANAEIFASKIRNTGAIFIGGHTPEAIGDYVAGSNHVLPTARSARFSSGLGVLDFMKRTSILKCGPQQLGALGPAAIALAEAEGLDAHARSVAIRINSR
jgi:transposase